MDYRQEIGMKKENSLEKILTNLVAFIGVFLVSYQFIFNRSLWRDEAKLALNILHKSPIELFSPLENLQVAPVLFLQIEKLFSTLLPNSELGLRLFPLMCYFLALFLFIKLSRLLFAHSYATVLSISLFVFNATLIYYSSELKQYMTDVLVLIAIYYFLLKAYKNEKTKYYVLAAMGALSIFLSNITPIVLLTAGLYLVYDHFKGKKKWISSLVPLFLVWGTTFTVYFFAFVHNHPLRSRMMNFWSHGGFMPKHLFSAEFKQFFLEKLAMVIKMNGSTAMLPVFHRALNEIIVLDVILCILLVFGFVYLIKKRRFDVLLLTAVPFIVHLLLSALKAYPFETRLVLYTIPLVIVVASFGFRFLVETAFSFFKIERSSFLLFVTPVVLAFLFVNAQVFPIENMELKKSLKYLEENMFQDDKVFVSAATKPVFEYYLETSFTDLNAENLILERKVIRDSIHFLNVLEPLAGRVWFVFDSDFQYPVSYFESQNKKPLVLFKPHGSVLYLYDIR